jgi:predicted nucleotidyltransferase
MPTRSLTSSVLRWPDARTVDEAIRRWAAEMARERPEVVRIGYFGSYARGDWGVGSDLDVVIVVERADRRVERRGVAWDTRALPVPADVLIYTEDEWRALGRSGSFGQHLMRETIWVVARPTSSE